MDRECRRRPSTETVGNTSKRINLILPLNSVVYRSLAMGDLKQPLSDEEQLPHRPFIKFGEDISTEILIRLPVKSLLKFKYVSKQWLSIVSSPRFRKTHTSMHRARAPPTALHFKFFGTNTYLVLPFNINPSNISILCFPYKEFSYPSRPRYCKSSCNGLQLLQSFNDTYYVYNPTTNDMKTLVNIPQSITKNEYVCASLAFDPSQSLDYKVVFTWPKPNLCQYQLEVYSSATGECKPPACRDFVGSFDYYENRGVFCNGAIHWLSKDSLKVVYFNVHTECIKSIQIPQTGGKIFYFGESQGHLVKSDSHEYLYQCSFLYVYELERDYSGLFLKYQVEFDSIRSTLQQLNVEATDNYGTSLSIIRDGEGDEDESVLLVWVWDEWVEYNFKKKTTKRLCKFVQPNLSTFYPHWTYWFNAYPFIPTLACV